MGADWWKVGAPVLIDKKLELSCGLNLFRENIMLKSPGEKIFLTRKDNQYIQGVNNEPENIFTHFFTRQVVKYFNFYFQARFLAA